MQPKVSASDPAAKYPSRVLRVLWWTLVVTPGVSLVFAVAAAMFADSADEAIPFGEVPLFLVMLVAGFMALLKAFLDRHLSLRERLITVGLPVAAVGMLLVSAFTSYYIGWPEKGRQVPMALLALILCALSTWAVIRIKPHVWRITADPGARAASTDGSRPVD